MSANWCLNNVDIHVEKSFIQMKRLANDFTFFQYAIWISYGHFFNNLASDRYVNLVFKLTNIFKEAVI